MIKPKDIKVTDIDGVEHTYTIDRFNSDDGIEILYQLPISGIPKIGDFDTLKKVKEQIFASVYVGNISLETKALRINHISDGETQLKILKEILEYNYSFLQRGIVSIFLENLTAKIPGAARQILTELYTQYSAKNKRR
jgi:hypothetical protein